MSQLTVGDAVLAAMTPEVMKRVARGWAISKVFRDGCEMVPYWNIRSVQRVGIPKLYFTPDCTKDLTRSWRDDG